MEIWQYLIPGICTIFVTLIEVRAAKDRSSFTKERELAISRSATRSEEGRLQMQMVAAVLQLALVTAKFVTGQPLDNEVTEAMVATKDAQSEYDDFVRVWISSEKNKE